MRSAEKDLELCGKVLPGPWKVEDWGVGFEFDPNKALAEICLNPENCNSENDMSFIAESREALPHWINESLKARELLIEISAHFQSDFLNEFDVKDWIKRVEEFLGGDEG